MIAVRKQADHVSHVGNAIEIEGAARTGQHLHHSQQDTEAGDADDCERQSAVVFGGGLCGDQQCRERNRHREQTVHGLRRRKRNRPPEAGLSDQPIDLHDNFTAGERMPDFRGQGNQLDRHPHRRGEPERQWNPECGASLPS
ncbi:hypothetical protein [Sphingopyxis sp.]|uniref:hypothetical protein n=1 Tax=Sphingopyxis sp. TaxID=1908224 RepID=UPI0025F2DE22|nr:hypothetical protein [Sphingopyxis sp.]MBK6414356.1 hypothetical protein [Sphingopyxis sp.]